MPYLSGERTPHNDPTAQGVFFGMTHDTTSASLAQAVLEGVGFAFADGLDALADTGAEIGTITMIGGGARSEYWGTILSAILDRSLVYRDGGTFGPSYGAARLAHLALTEEATDVVCAPPQITNVIEPDDRQVDHYAGRRRLFRALYPQLKDLFWENRA